MRRSTRGELGDLVGAAADEDRAPDGDADGDADLANVSLMPAAMPLCCLGTTLTATSAITGFRRPTLAAGIDHLFEARIDGVVAEREHLAGKPAPDTFLAGARVLGAEPAQAAVFEDALAGVEAGRAWIFAVWVRTPSRSNRHVVMPAGSYALAFAPRLRPRLARLTFDSSTATGGCVSTCAPTPRPTSSSTDSRSSCSITASASPSPPARP